MGIAKRLKKHIRCTGRKCIERWKDKNACKAVCQAGIEGNMLNRSPEPELVVATDQRCGVYQLDMILGPGGIEERRLPQAHNPGDFQKCTLGIWREIDSAAC